MEKQKIAAMALGFILIAMASFFLTKEQSDSIKFFSTTSIEKDSPSSRITSNVTIEEVSSQKIDRSSTEQLQLPEESTDNPAQLALKNYYKYITEKKFREAYDTLTWDMQNHMGTYEDFSNDYDETISSVAQNVMILSSNDTETILQYDLIARDKFKRDRVKVQNFSGVATLKLENDIWKIDSMKVKKTCEHVD